MANSIRVSFEPSFLDGAAGRIFVVAYPAASDERRDALVVVPAFAEEMNKSRRQIALLGRALQQRNVATFVPDLHGTGDSDGDFGEATVSRWRDDLDRVFEHVHARSYTSVSVLGVRGGALLALDYLNASPPPLARRILWQPVIAGKTMISQFLRLKAAASLTGSGKGASVGDLRKTLAGDASVEVAGYTLSPQLVREFDALNLSDWSAEGDLNWLQVGAADAPIPPAAAAAMVALKQRDIPTHFRSVTGEPFWSTAEIALAPALIDATVALFA